MTNSVVTPSNRGQSVFKVPLKTFFISIPALRKFVSFANMFCFSSMRSMVSIQKEIFISSVFAAGVVLTKVFHSKQLRKYQFLWFYISQCFT